MDKPFDFDRRTTGKKSCGKTQSGWDVLTRVRGGGGVFFAVVIDEYLILSEPFGSQKRYAPTCDREITRAQEKDTGKGAERMVTGEHR